ncbi:MAG TPA: VOC family protein, partial [Mycobacteriales bacterium]|nr:VOC family protein [Mycobacteriales bacterium]
VDDLAGESAALSASGIPREVCGSVDGQEPFAFAYHTGAHGIRIELVDRALIGDWRTFLVENSGPTTEGA